jgi:hypothetical protein
MGLAVFEATGETRSGISPRGFQALLAGRLIEREELHIPHTSRGRSGRGGRGVEREAAAGGGGEDEAGENSCAILGKDFDGVVVDHDLERNLRGLRMSEGHRDAAREVGTKIGLARMGAVDKDSASGEVDADDGFFAGRGIGVGCATAESNAALGSVAGLEHQAQEVDAS